MMRSVTICDVRIDCVTLDEAVERALAMQRNGEVCRVFTPNALMLEKCRHDVRLSELLNRATLSLPDGSGVLRAAKRIGVNLPERVAGIDFGEKLLSRAAKEGLSVFLLGGARGITERAAFELQKKNPDLRICGTHHGFFSMTGEENEQVCALIRAAAPDILFVCMGFPMQETWICSNLSRLPSVRIAAGLGGSLDVWSGCIKRAPHALRVARLEWAWRMLREPKRLKDLPSLARFYWKT